MKHISEVLTEFIDHLFTGMDLGEQDDYTLVADKD